MANKSLYLNPNWLIETTFYLMTPDYNKNDGYNHKRLVEMRKILIDRIVHIKCSFNV